MIIYDKYAVIDSINLSIIHVINRDKIHCRLYSASISAVRWQHFHLVEARKQSEWNKKNYERGRK